MPARAASASGNTVCKPPYTTWAKGGATSGDLKVYAGPSYIYGNEPYYFTRQVDSGKYNWPVLWSASGTYLAFGKGFCA